MHTEERHCDDKAKMSYASQERDFRRKLPSPHLDLGLSTSKTFKTSYSVVSCSSQSTLMDLHFSFPFGDLPHCHGQAMWSRGLTPTHDGVNPWPITASENLPHHCESEPPTLRPSMAGWRMSPWGSEPNQSYRASGLHIVNVRIKTSCFLLKWGTQGVCD